MTSRRRLYTGLPKTKRLLILDEDVDRAIQDIAAREGVTVNALYNVATLQYLAWHDGMRPADPAPSPHNPESALTSASYAGGSVHASLDSFGQAVPEITAAYDEARTKLAGTKKRATRAKKKES